jgi:integrase
MSDLADYFLNVYARERRLSKKYVSECKALLTHIILPRWGNLKVKAITHDDIRRLKIDMELKPVRANRCLALLSKMFSLAIEKGIRADNPVKGIERNVEAKRERFMSLGELERLMRVLAKQEDQLQANGIRLLVLTGARVGEVLSAEWDHFDLDDGIWTKPPSNTKQRRVHRAPLSSPALEILRRMKSVNVGSPFLFPRRSNLMRPRESFRKFWLKVRTDAALGNVVLYTARHTYASHLLVSGVPLGVIGALLGHSQPSTTARYAHVGDSAGKAATEKMGDILEHIRGLIAEPTDGLI